ncbi:hypothetical protein BT67DRAFT_126952 [Trichocladium antarcticum]|uniref:Uncharacterized protein n=1 Tax=Trichocladium antarcticum TaxID=1450529 RepID=A0AAN6URN8_9PEZI|nr:hypothetical protein BT67DRAFT_126952 [Trichocladium antarcticum]
MFGCSPRPLLRWHDEQLTDLLHHMDTRQRPSSSQPLHQESRRMDHRIMRVEQPRQCRPRRAQAGSNSGNHLRPCCAVVSAAVQLQTGRRSPVVQPQRHDPPKRIAEPIAPFPAGPAIGRIGAIGRLAPTRHRNAPASSSQYAPERKGAGHMHAESLRHPVPAQPQAG